MTTRITVPHIEIGPTRTPKGRGAFTLQALQPGDIVEVCPLIVFQCPFTDLPRALQESVFNWTVLAQLTEPNLVAIALGYGGLYNGDNPANLRYEAVTGESEPLMRFIADRRIAKDEELTVNYSARGGGTRSDDNGWYENLGITPILSR
jgi:hypothetical protein